MSPMTLPAVVADADNQGPGYSQPPSQVANSCLNRAPRFSAVAANYVSISHAISSTFEDPFLVIPIDTTNLGIMNGIATSTTNVSWPRRRGKSSCLLDKGGTGVALLEVSFYSIIKICRLEN